MQLSQRAWLLALALLCVAVVGAALVTQHVFDMLPCPWCILQRIIFLVIALLLLAVYFFYRTLVSRRVRVENHPLTEAERAEAQRLLASAGNNKNAS